ncbi:MAG: preprotein translocase subunit SecA [Planctomycetes bacterium]|nr:preprotein translocase subunit SecA [Planctomycetota bacterium]
MIENLFRGIVKVFGSHNERQIKALRAEVARINALEPAMEALSDAELRAKTDEFRGRLKNGETLEDITCEAFAVVREASKRTPPPGETKGLRHYDVQLVGGLVLHRSGIAEMATGEGKTLVATCPAYLNALEGKGVHVITVNDYLAQRDRDWMGPVYESLGLTVGAIQSEMGNAERRKQYDCDITYGTNNEFGFDYLRDNMKSDLRQQVQRSRNFAILDEVDNILIDEARTPLIISGPGEGDTRKYFEADRIARKLHKDRDFEVKEKESQVLLTEEGIENAQGLAGVETFYTGKHMEWPHLLEQALRAHYLFHKDKDYIVDQEDGKPAIVIIDEFTGRAMPGRRWSDGLHQAVEAKEGISIKAESQTLATITFQNFFKLYDKISGMTGTAMTEAGEFLKIYALNVVAIPTNRVIQRDDLDDKIYADQKDKYNAVVDEIREIHRSGRPILVGTTSIENSERLSVMLDRCGVQHNVLNAKHHQREAEIIALAGQKNSVTIATNMAGRGTDIKLGAGVRELGGLHVLGTERHEARRIDNQLRGRCGRQGDPGTTRFYLALDDDLMRRFASGNVAALLQKLGLRDGQSIEHRWINKSIANAQKKVENRNFEIRKNLLEYDDVMNEQRTLVYSSRHQILNGEGLREMVESMFEEVTNSAIDLYLGDDDPSEWNWDGLGAWFQRKTGRELKVDRSAREPDAVFDKILGEFKLAYEDCYEKSGAERMAILERYLLLNAFDVKWKEQLANMDALKSGIGLRSYAQVDPKIEYKREAYDLFGAMIQAIREEVTDLILRVEIRREEEEEVPARDVWKGQEASHQQFGQYESSRAANEAAIRRDQAAKPAKPFVHKEDRVGRNDPCPCGSGKKYKKCHGSEG